MIRDCVAGLIVRPVAERLLSTSRSTPTRRLPELTLLSVPALICFCSSNQAECRLQPGILPLEDLNLVETLLR